MAGISEKGNNGLFGNEVEFNGKYATYARFLKDEVGVFQTFREVYVIGAIVGYLNNRTESKDEGDKVQSASIFPNELSKRKIDLRHIYRTIMLLKEEEGFTLMITRIELLETILLKIRKYIRKICRYLILMPVEALNIYMRCLEIKIM